MSGIIACLEDIKEKLFMDGYFARFLQVDLAYRFKYMAKIGRDYEALLEQNFKPLDRISGSVEMFFSVYGHKMSGSTDAKYWKANMISAVDSKMPVWPQRCRFPDRSQSQWCTSRPNFADQRVHGSRRI